MKRINYKSLQKEFPELFSNQNALIEIITDPKQIGKWQESEKNKKTPISLLKIGVVYRDRFIVLIRDLVKFPNGKINSYFRLFNQADLSHGQGVVILPFRDDKIMLLHQYRHPIRSWSYEFPRGFGEPGITAEQQARAEMNEEIGASVEKLIDLGLFHSNTGLEGNKVRLFLAFINTTGLPQIEEGIDKAIWVSKNEIEEMIANETITDGFTISAYARAKFRGII